MDEDECVVAVSTFLENNGYRYFVDSSYDSEMVSELPEKLHNCGVNDAIRIGRRKPDLIGYNENGEILAIEVKGDGDPRKGIGQAAHYRVGVHRSYLAAPESALDEFRGTIKSCGIGMFSVDPALVEDGQPAGVSKIDPVENLAATQLNKTRRALAIKTSGFETERDAFSSSTMPLNALLPVISIGINDGTRQSIPLSDCVQTIVDHEDGLGKNTFDHAVSLSRTLQLTEIHHTDVGRVIGLTELGQLTNLLLKGRVNSIGQWSLGLDQNQLPDGDYDTALRYLKKLKYKRSPVYEHDPEIAAFLRDRYLSIPDVRVLVQALAEIDGESAELSEVLAEVAMEAPDVFINLLLDSRRVDDFQQLVEDSGGDLSSPELRRKLLDMSSPDYMYNFVRQLTHVHILHGGNNSVHQEDHDDLEIGDCSWTWKREIVGEIGFGL
jgi:hypothetical protein